MSVGGIFSFAASNETERFIGELCGVTVAYRLYSVQCVYS